MMPRTSESEAAREAYAAENRRVSTSGHVTFSLARPDGTHVLTTSADLGPGTTSAGKPKTPVQSTTRCIRRPHERYCGDGPGCGNSRDEADRAARAGGSDKRRYRSDSCVGIR